jgi:hypothetical protein
MRRDERIRIENKGEIKMKQKQIETIKSKRMNKMGEDQTAMVVPSLCLICLMGRSI